MAWEGPFEGALGGVAYIIGSQIWESVDGGQTWILSKFIDDCDFDEFAEPA
jgi:hypothetical protein